MPRGACSSRRTHRDRDVVGGPALAACASAGKEGEEASDESDSDTHVELLCRRRDLSVLNSDANRP